MSPRFYIAKCLRTRVFSLSFFRFLSFAILLSGILVFSQNACAVDVTLAWDANSEEDLEGYRIFYREDGQNYDYDNPAWQGTATTCTISGLDDNTTHHFVARAYDTSDNESTDSDEATYQSYTLLLSTSSDRSNSVSLQGETVTGNIFVFTSPDEGVEQVSFYLDDPDMNGAPRQVEEAIHYDFAGTAGDGSANPFDTTQISNGQHEITAFIELTAGGSRTVSATFTVANGTPPTLTSLNISGSSSVNESSTSSYAATATFSDGSTQTVTASADWSENSSYASISASGVLTSTAVPSNQTVTITASYTHNGVTRTDQKAVTIVDVPPTLTSLSISGSSSVNEETSSSYTATARFSDGSTQTVTGSADWSEDSSYASISGSGVLTASEVTGDETVIITASYTSGGVTRTAQKVVTITDVPESNLPPSTPVITSPYDGQMECELTPTIVTEAFSDPDGDPHSQSQWQISKQENFSSAILDSSTAEHLTELAVPHTLLEAETTYYIRVRFYDVHLASSEWSDNIEFTTAADSDDLDGDGVPDAQEVGYGVDLDGNGVDDIEEPENIRSVQSSDGITLGVSKGSDSVTGIEAVEIIDPSTILDNTNRPSDLSHGLFSYRITVDQVGATATMRIYYAEPIPSGMTFYKYDTINGWADYSQHTTFNDDGLSITLEVKDGGYGDTDGNANGIIVDPGGLGSSGTEGSGGVDSAVSGGGPSGGGCFIASAGCNSSMDTNINTSSGLLVLIGLLVMVCFYRVRENKCHTFMQGS